MVVDEKFCKEIGLVIKPQIDLDKFTPGTPIYVKGNGGKDPFYTFSHNCLVVQAKPLSITVVYVQTPKKFNSDSDSEYLETKTLEIPVEKIAQQEVLIKFLNETKPIF